MSVPGVDPALLDPRSTWADPDAYDAKAAELAAMFRANFATFDDVEPGQSPPQALAAAVLTQDSHSRGYKGHVALLNLRRLAAFSRGRSSSSRSPLVAAHGASANANPAWARTIDAYAQPRASELSAAQAPAGYRGGPITTSTGETVDVRVSDALPADTVTPEGWAEFLAAHDARARARAADRVHPHVRRGPAGLRDAGARLLRARRARRAGRDGVRHDARGGRAARVRASHRVSPAESALVGDRLGPEAVGERSERLRARRPQGGIPGRRDDELHAEPGRGVGGGLPAHGRAKGRDHDGDLAHHRAQLLPRRPRPDGGRAGRHAAVDRSAHDPPLARRSARRRRASGGFRSRPRSTATCVSARRFPGGAARSTSRWSARIARPSFAALSG